MHLVVMTILIFCGGLGLLGESIFGTSFNRRADRDYRERKAREEKNDREYRIIRRFRDKYCFKLPIAVSESEKQRFIEEKYSMTKSDFHEYACKRLREILNNSSNLTRLLDQSHIYEYYLYKVGYAIKIIDSGLLPDSNCVNEWYGSIFGFCSEYIYYYLKPDIMEELASWAAETMREKGVPIALISGEEWNQYGFWRERVRCFIDLYKDPIKCSKRYGLSDS